MDGAPSFIFVQAKYTVEVGGVGQGGCLLLLSFSLFGSIFRSSLFFLRNTEWSWERGYGCRVEGGRASAGTCVEAMQRQIGLLQRPGI